MVFFEGDFKQFKCDEIGKVSIQGSEKVLYICENKL